MAPLFVAAGAGSVLFQAETRRVAGSILLPLAALLEVAATEIGVVAPQHFRDIVLPAMETLREAGDALEVIIPHETWPLATYREMLFIK